MLQSYFVLSFDIFIGLGLGDLTHIVHTQTYQLATQQCFITCVEFYNIGDTWYTEEF